ncbi:hypothetical protein M0802_015147, partial [Mischocyttarus mexicanus]
IVEVKKEIKEKEKTVNNDSPLLLEIGNSKTVPIPDREICRNLDTYIANSTGEDAIAIDVEEAVANIEYQQKVDANMSKIQTNNTTGINSILPVLSRFKYEYFIAGISGGVVSTLTLHPLDLIKIRLAVNDGRTSVPQYSGIIDAFRQIVKSEGIRGFYRGVTPNVLGSGCSWGLYFFFYNNIKTCIQGGNSKKPLGPSLHMLAAADAGLLTLLMTNPIWVVKTRLCLQYVEDKDLAECKKYKGVTDALKKIYKTEGIKGLYKGLIPGMFGVSHGAIQFMTYEEMKNRYTLYWNLPIDSKLVSFQM